MVLAGAGAVECGGAGLSVMTLLHRGGGLSAGAAALAGASPFEETGSITGTWAGDPVPPYLTCRPQTQCCAKCPCTCKFDWLSDQLCQSLDQLPDHFAKHWCTCAKS